MMTRVNPLSLYTFRDGPCKALLRMGLLVKKLILFCPNFSPRNNKKTWRGISLDTWISAIVMDLGLLILFSCVPGILYYISNIDFSATCVCVFIYQNLP